MTFQSSLDPLHPLVPVPDAHRANGGRRASDASCPTQASSELFMGQGSTTKPTSVAKPATFVAGDVSQQRHRNVASHNVANSTYGERVCAWLIALYPRKTADCVADDLRCAPATIRKMLERRSAPAFGLGLRMLDAYGPDFAAAVLPGCRWMSDAAVRARHERIDAAMQALADQKARLPGGAS